MKYFNTLLSVIICLMPVISCSDFDSKERNDSSVDDFSLLTNGLTRSQNEVANSLLNFSLNCFREMASDKIDNCLVSPYSLAADLSMLSLGASGETYNELTTVLGFEGYSYEQVGDYYSTMTKRVCSSESLLSVANAIWLDNTIEEYVKPEFKEDVKFFKADINALDFKSDYSAGIINDWARAKTSGMIDRIVSIDELQNNGAIAILTNAISFNGKWTDNSYSIGDMQFKSLSGKITTKSSFEGRGYCIREYNVSGKRKNEPSIVQLKIDDNYSMSFILPPEKKSLKMFVSSLDSEKWVRWMLSLKPGVTESTVVDFKIPSFQSDAEYQSIKYLENLGIKSLFKESDCNLSRMINMPVSVSCIKQKTAIDVNSKGSNASSVSTIEISQYFGINSSNDTRQKLEFIADRPFVYAIVENTTQTILFMGTVTE